MELNLYQIDAFTGTRFGGNPAAICPLEEWLPDPLLQSIAQENNLSETAFFVRSGDRFRIRWFTPVAEVDLCGHATLASAFVLFEILRHDHDRIVFDSRSGELNVLRKEGWLVLDFPLQQPVPCDLPAPVRGRMATAPIECLQSEDYLFVFDREEEVAVFDPPLELFKQLDCRGVIVTAPSDRCDFVCRFFAPKFGIPEDPVTGSAFTQLAPYWAARLGKTALIARQISSRGGDVKCEVGENRVAIAGQAVLYLEGKIRV